MFESRAANVIGYGGLLALLVVASISFVPEAPMKSMDGGSFVPVAPVRKVVAPSATPAPAITPVVPSTQAAEAPRPIVERFVQAPVRPLTTNPVVEAPKPPRVLGDPPKPLGSLSYPLPVDTGDSISVTGVEVQRPARFVPPADIGR